MKKFIIFSFTLLIFAFGLLVLLCFALRTSPYYHSQKLIDAVKVGDLELVQQLLESGIDPNLSNAPVLPIVNTFIEHSPQKPLSVACELGNYEMVKLLISYGATASYTEHMGWSPLATSLFYYQEDDIEIINLLLENGADPSMAEAGWFPAFRASRMIPKNYDPTKSNGTVFSSGYDEEVAKGITEIVKLLMRDCDPNDQSYAGITLLMNASKVGNLELVKYLLSINVDVTLKDVNGKTAYDYAIEKGHSDIVELLRGRVGE